MIILNDKRNENTVKFKDLKVGDLFLHVETEKAKYKFDGIFIKINDFSIQEKKSAVELNTGNIYEFSDLDKVEYIKAIEINLLK